MTCKTRQKPTDKTHKIKLFSSANFGSIILGDLFFFSDLLSFNLFFLFQVAGGWKIGEGEPRSWSMGLLVWVQSSGMMAGKRGKMRVSAGQVADEVKKRGGWWLFGRERRE